MMECELDDGTTPIEWMFNGKKLNETEGGLHLKEVLS